jgi:hypothetical protein
VGNIPDVELAYRAEECAGKGGIANGGFVLVEGGLVSVSVTNWWRLACRRELFVSICVEGVYGMFTRQANGPREVQDARRARWSMRWLALLGLLTKLHCHYRLLSPLGHPRYPLLHRHQGTTKSSYRL